MGAGKAFSTLPCGPEAKGGPAELTRLLPYAHPYLPHPSGSPQPPPSWHADARVPRARRAGRGQSAMLTSQST